jgi:hypothetical protein
MSYPVASQVLSYRPAGYEVDHKLVPHGHSVIVNAPSVFAFTGDALPERHLKCAEILTNRTFSVNKYGADAGKVRPKYIRVLFFVSFIGVRAFSVFINKIMMFRSLRTLYARSWVN